MKNQYSELSKSSKENMKNEIIFASQKILKNEDNGIEITLFLFFIKYSDRFYLKMQV